MRVQERKSLLFHGNAFCVLCVRKAIIVDIHDNIILGRSRAPYQNLRQVRC